MDDRSGRGEGEEGRERPHAAELDRRDLARRHESSSGAVEKDGAATPDDDRFSSAWSERHMQGPPSRPLSRTTSHRTERTATAITTTTAAASAVLARMRLRAPRPSFTHPLTHEKTTARQIVDFDGPGDPYRPLNWPWKKKAATTLLYGFNAMSAAFASSVYSPAAAHVAAEFHVGPDVALLGISLFLVGCGIGPLLWAPLSEVYGRKLAVLVPFFVSAVFAFAAGAAKDLPSLMICRFWQGVFGSAPITNTGGVMSDIWTPAERGAAMIVYALAVMAGPTLGPVIGGAVIVRGLGWRWTQYITGILTLVLLGSDVLILDESYAPALLVAKARRLRHESGNWALHARHEEWDVSLAELGQKYLVRPFQLLATPICALMALYASFCYGILYASLAALPIGFGEERGWNELVASLPLLAMLVGSVIGSGANLLNQKFYVRRWEANDYRPVPEARLPPMMAGSVAFASGLFIFAWTSDRSLPWIAPCVGIALVGTACFTIIQAALNYLIDTFQRYAASAVAANTALRSGFSAALPLLVAPMLHHLGIGWGISVFGFIATAMIPIPYCFYIYGPRIRARGCWSRESV